LNNLADLVVLHALETLADPALRTEAGKAIILNMPITGAEGDEDAFEQALSDRLRGHGRIEWSRAG
jgi:hypothetical protein